MLESIRKTNTFQTDVNRYSEVINKMPDGTNKSEMTRLLSTLVYEVKKMDDLHNELIYNKQMASIGTEFREKIQNIRKQLEGKCKEFTSSSKD